MSRRNNNQDPSQFTYNAFLKIQLREGDLYYHFYFHNRGTDRFRIEVKKPRDYRRPDHQRPRDYVSNARFYMKPDVTEDEMTILIDRHTTEILRNNFVDLRNVRDIYYVEELKRFLTDEEYFRHNLQA